MDKKITQKEFDKYVRRQLHAEGFLKREIDMLSSAFSADLQDKEHGDRGGLFSKPVAGVSAEELEKRMAELRDPSSPLSKSLKYPLHKYPDKLDKVEEIMRKALEDNKEPLF